MNIGYDPNLNILLCPKFNGKFEVDESGDLKCLDCGYIYHMFSDGDNSFQMELFDD